MPIATRQKLLFSEKNDKWKKDTVEYIYSKCRPNVNSFDHLYRAANGELDLADYAYLLKPYGDAIANRPQLQNYPAKMRNYPIIPSIFQLVLGEKRDTPLLAQVVATNPDSINKKKAEEALAIKNALQQTFINTANELGMDTGVDSKPIPPLDQITKMFNSSWSDQRSVAGQEALNYIIDELDIPEKFIQGFKHWFITGMVCSIKDVVNEDIIYRILNPNYVGFIADENTEYLEDAEAVCVTEQMTRSSFIDKYWSLIKDSLITEEGITEKEAYNGLLDELDKDQINSVGGSFFYNNVFGSSNSTNISTWNNRGIAGFETTLSDTVIVSYVNWTSLKLIKTISTPNEMGELEIIDVADDYEVQKEFGETLIKETWVNEKWEGYMLEERKYFFGVQPIPMQRNMFNNKSACKNLVNGKIRRVGNRKQLSPVELVLPYQHLYNFAHYKLNNILAKNKDKLMIMPMGLIPKHDGWDMYTSMYYADSTGYLFIDETDDRTGAALNAIKAVDLSLSNYIQYMQQYLASIKAEAEAVLGITPQRKAEISAGDGLGTTTTAIAQSSVITSDLFEEYQKFEERELNGFLDLSRIAYINGKKAVYRNSAGRTVYLEINAGDIDYANSEFGIRVSSGAKEKEKLNKMKAFAETMASQKAKGSTLARILNHEGSFSELITELDDIEAMEDEMAQQQAQAEADQKNQDLQAKLLQQSKELDVAYYKIDQDNITKREVALIGSDTQLALDSNNDGVPDYQELAEHSLKRDQMMQEGYLKKRELDLKDKEINTKAKVEIYKSENDLKIAKENKNSAEVKAKRSKK